MKYCPHEIFDDEIARNYPQTKKQFQNMQRNHRAQSKIENFEDDKKIDSWKTLEQNLDLELKKEEKFIKNLQKKCSFISGISGFLISSGISAFLQNQRNKKNTNLKKISYFKKLMFISLSTGISAYLGYKYHEKIAKQDKKIRNYLFKNKEKEKE